MNYEYALIYAEKIDLATKKKSKEALTERVTRCDMTSIENTLNMMGMIGWELVHVMETDNQLVWYFKKSIPWWNFWS